MRRHQIENDHSQVEQPGAPLHVKYRPRKLTEVIGQPAIVKSLTETIKSKTRPHAFLFTGPSGCGKTTLARIMADAFDCLPQNITEIDAASNSGIEAMKDVMSTTRYNGFGDSPNRALIIDECHALSKAAWQALLKPIEEPPPHVYFFLCTTENGKVPETVVTRCQAHMLKPLRYDDTLDLIEAVVKAERFDVPEKITAMAARACGGSPRQALQMLAMLQGVSDEDEAARLLETPLDNKEIIDLCRLVIDQRLSWEQLQKTIKAMPDMSPESARIVIVNYLSACLLGSRGDKQTRNLLDCLYEFSKPFNATDKWAPLLLAFGNLIYAG